jgi:uncharacterized protein YecE (DUF72 family)
MTHAKKVVNIGTSGWQYEHWNGTFYPSDLSNEGQLSFYAQHLNTVEVNSTFYGLPDQSTVKKWREQTPPNFIFSVKASRYLTHMKKLKDPQEPLSHLLESIAGLKGSLGPVLFQLPPNWSFNPDRLLNILEILPPGHHYAFEFRDSSWFDTRAFEALEKHQVAFCIYDLNGQVSPKEITAGFVYVRLHGPMGPYKGKYDTQELAGWAGAFSAWSREGKDIYCYFNNDMAGYAVQNALELQAMFTEDK